MNKLTFQDYFPHSVGRPPITEINVLRYLSRYGKTRRAKIARDFGKHNQEINNVIIKLVKQGLLSNYCDLCKIKIEDYKIWKDHKKNTTHKNNLKNEQKNENIEKSKPVIIITKKGFEIAIYDPLKHREYDFLEEDKIVKKVWPVISTVQFWNILIEIFYNSNEIDDLEYLCKVYENSILEIFRENMSPQYFKNMLHEFKRTEKDIMWLEKIKKEEMFFEDVILKIIAHVKSDKISESNIIKQIKKSYKFNKKLFEKNFERLISKGIIEKTIKRKQKVFQISHLGIILLFHHLYTDSIFYSRPTKEFEKIIDSIRPKNIISEKLFYRNFEKIRKKYSYLLPMILNDENFEKLNLEKIVFLKIFNELYFSDRESSFREHNFDNFRKFYEIRDIDFGKKFDNYITSFSFSKMPQDELFEKTTSYLESHSKKYLKAHVKMIKSKAEQTKSLVYVKNTSDRVWTSYKPVDMLFDKAYRKIDENFPLRNQLSIKFKNQIMMSMENKITFDFYSSFRKCDVDFGMSFNNDKVDDWYITQLEQLSKYTSHYFDKIMM